MIRIADWEPLRFQQSQVGARGHAIEVRINAEDATRNFMPQPGAVTGLTVLGGFGVRFDSLLYRGCFMPSYYDSLLGKLVVWDETRVGALARLRRALAELKIEGIATTIPLHIALVSDPDVAGGRIHTRGLEDWLDRR